MAEERLPVRGTGEQGRVFQSLLGGTLFETGDCLSKRAVVTGGKCFSCSKQG